MRRLLRCALVSLALSGAAVPAISQQDLRPAEEAVKEVQLATGKLVRAAPLPSWALPLADVPSTHRKDPLVLRLAETQISANGLTGYLVHRALQVNDASALAQIGQYGIGFVPEYQQLLLHSVRILRGGEIHDRTETVKIRVLERETGLENGVYSGQVSAVLLLEDVRIGDTLQITYTTVGANPVFGGTFSQEVSWDQPEATELRKVSLVMPQERKIAWRMQGDREATAVVPQESIVNGARILRFEGRGMDAVRTEPQTPAEYLHARFLQFSEYRDWASVGLWAQGLFARDARLPSELQPVLERLRSLPSREQRASEALQWVQNEIRYFSVSLGESSHRPYAPSEVVHRRYGDCKDKTLLLVTILREVGIEAVPVLVSARAPKRPSRMLPSPDVFDHVIARVKIGSNVYLLDPTRIGQRGPLARMGTVPEGSSLLVVAPGASALESSPKVSPELSMVELSESLTMTGLGKDGSLVAKARYHGARAEYLRVFMPHLTVEQRRQAILSDYERRYPGITLEDDPKLSDDVERNIVSLESRFRVPNLAKQTDGSWWVPYAPANLIGVVQLPPQLQRNTPAVILHKPYAARYEVTVTWPPEIAMILDPDSERLNSEFFEVDMRRAFRGNVATMSLRYDARTDIATPKDMTRLVEDTRQLSRIITGAFVVPTDAIKKTFAADKKPASVQAVMTSRLETRIARLTKAIDGGGLKGDDLAEALCDRAESLADIGRAVDGVVDSIQAVKVAPGLPRALFCRANLYFATGQFDKALPDYTKALTLGNDLAWTLYRRGQARFYSGQFSAAAEDFEQAAKAKKGEESDALYMRLWHIWALQRAGLEIPQPVRESATREPLGAWPRPALAMVLGALTPEQMLAEVQKKTGDDRELTLAEAWFYAGQHYRAQGELARAREAWERARAQGVTMYLEHVAAGFELGQLK
ncbi:Lipoprotein NlpI [Rhodocyclaceae bacterium]|nr:Lipoprotein NlpI [Rhodocyclaceae bacterium]